MTGQIVRNGLLAGLVGILWTTLLFGFLPLRSSMGWKEVPNEAAVLQVLDSSLLETGLYLVPGNSPPDSLFRARHADGPFFRVHALRTGADYPLQALISLAALLLAPLIPAWFLSGLCRRESPTYVARVGVVALFGVFVTLTSELQLWGMELYPLGYSLLLSAHAITSWVVMGLFLAWRIKPAPPVSPAS